MPTLLIEPFGGMAGDMFLAALLDLGDPRFTFEDLELLATDLVPGECELALAATHRGGIAAHSLTVRTPESHDPPHRHYADLEALVARSTSLSPRSRRRALAALWRIAVAEGAVHDEAPEEIHFHEIGAVDTLIDVCGAALALERLQIDRIVSTPPLAGEGTVHCAHGELPVPTPAVVEILRGYPLVRGGGRGERLTPTAAAILREWVDAFDAPGSFAASATGYGAGRRDPQDGPPNLVRVQLGDEIPSPQARTTAWLLELNLDDATGEEQAFLVAGLREAGALDVWITPIQMKKNRPGTLVSALCREGERALLETIVFERSSSLGLRWTRTERTECERDIVEIELAGERVRVKRRLRPDRPGASPFGPRDLSPEHEDLARLARATGASLRELEQRAIAIALETYRAPSRSSTPS